MGMEWQRKKKRNLHGVEITIGKDYEEVSRIASMLILDRVRKTPDMSFLFSTGATQKGTFLKLGEHASLFRESKVYNMYEYCILKQGKLALIDADDPRSFKKYMNEYFFHRIQVKEQYFPGIENTETEGLYDKFIEEKGGLDFALAATGIDAHTFGFNLPGVSFDSKTRVVEVNELNREAISKATGMETPAHAVTTGIHTGMRAREILFLVTGRSKAEALKNILSQPISPEYPATILRTHPNCQWVVDEEAVALIDA